MTNKNNHNTNYPSDSHHTSNTRIDKMGKKTLLTFGIALLLLISLSTVMASSVYAAYQKPETNAGPAALLQAQNQVEYQYKYQYGIECNEGCSMTSEFVGDQIRVQVREQKRLFGLFNVDAVSNYDINENAIITKARHNIWARLLNSQNLSGATGLLEESTEVDN